MSKRISYETKRKIKNVCEYILIFIVALFIIVFADEAKWNEGKCECGGQWELVDIESKTDSIMVEYFYTCNECDNTIYTHSAKHNN